jgi:hypothetical protein
MNVTDLWNKTSSFVINFEPNKFQIPEDSKRRIQILSIELISSFRELNEKIDIEDIRLIESKILMVYKELFELYRTIFEESSANPPHEY